LRSTPALGADEICGVRWQWVHLASWDFCKTSGEVARCRAVLNVERASCPFTVNRCGGTVRNTRAGRPCYVFQSCALCKPPAAALLRYSQRFELALACAWCAYVERRVPRVCGRTVRGTRARRPCYFFYSRPFVACPAIAFGDGGFISGLKFILCTGDILVNTSRLFCRTLFCDLIGFVGFLQNDVRQNNRSKC